MSEKIRKIGWEKASLFNNPDSEHSIVWTEVEEAKDIIEKLYHYFR